ncbi:hypothetical protein ACFV47_26115 [Streptomyces solisilvae]|uniref:hypothetical protein n=1 Tax=Streptomyces malaysiensis TaxID=92644 RepID=UPI00367D4A46
MIPVSQYEREPNIPSAATFWFPAEEDIPDDEGIGYFRDVWLILNEPEEETRRVLFAESRLMAIVDHLATSQDEYEIMVTMIEKEDPANMPLGELRDQMQHKIPEVFEHSEDAPSPLNFLELGVAGLSYALSTIGAVPVASCRGHLSGWSDRPVVYVALDQQRAEWLQPLVYRTGCGFHVGLNREEFLAIDAPSIRETHKLAESILGLFDSNIEQFDKWIDLSVIDSRYDEK